jgi:predicted RNA methylase
MNLSSASITKSAAAEILKVSVATVSNWMRSGVIGTDGSISAEDVNRTLEYIRTGEISRLAKRANKKFSLRTLNNPDKKTEGEMSRTGSYYTPEYIVSDIINSIKIKNGSVISDPCCGDGAFLSLAAKKFGRNVILFGTDTDETALIRASDKLSLLNTSRFSLNIADSLNENETCRYDFVFTNPPWGAYLTENEKRKLKLKYPDAGSGDSMEYFLLKGFSSLKRGGIMSYLLPSSYLNVARFKKSRKYFAMNSTILSVKNYGRIFEGVFTDVIRIDIKKEIPRAEHKISLCGRRSVMQSSFLNEPSFAYNTAYITDGEENIMKAVFSIPHITLKDNAEWSLGIVTGDNSGFVSKEKTGDYSLALISGGNIGRYRLSGELNYLKPDFEKMQQVPKNDLFMREKLFYRFISKKLVFAYDDSGLYSLNSANIVIPKLEGYTLKAVMAILNSKLMDLIYKRKFGGIKVLKSSLGHLPFPINPDPELIKKIEKRSDSIVKGICDPDRTVNEIDELVNKLYGVTL